MPQFQEFETMCETINETMIHLSNWKSIWGPTLTVEKLARLAELVSRALDHTMPGSMVVIRDEFAAESRYSLLLDVKPEGFDPRLNDAVQRAFRVAGPPGESRK